MRPKEEVLRQLVDLKTLSGEDKENRKTLILAEILLDVRDLLAKLDEPLPKD